MIPTVTTPLPAASTARAALAAPINRRARAPRAATKILATDSSDSSENASTSQPSSAIGRRASIAGADGTTLL